MPFLGWLLGDLVATLELFLGKKATFSATPERKEIFLGKKATFSATPERKERKLRYFSFFFGVCFRYDSS